MKGDRLAEATVARHMFGWEIRYEVDGEMVRTEVFREQGAFLIDLERRKTEFQAKGWIEE